MATEFVKAVVGGLAVDAAQEGVRNAINLALTGITDALNTASPAACAPICGGVTTGDAHWQAPQLRTPLGAVDIDAVVAKVFESSPASPAPTAPQPSSTSDTAAPPPITPALPPFWRPRCRASL